MLQALIPQTRTSRTREQALDEAPGRPVVLLRPAPVRVRSIIGHAVAYTVTHVLVEWESGGELNVKWEANWLVRRVPQGS